MQDRLKVLRRDVAGIARDLGLIVHDGHCGKAMRPGDLFFDLSDGTIWTVKDEALVKASHDDIAHLYAVIRKYHLSKKRRPCPRRKRG